MSIAIQLSEANVLDGLGGPFGAVVVKDNQVIAKSANMVTISNDPTAHAEVAAIRLASQQLNTFDLSDCVIYTSCEPCPMCLSAIYWARISTIYYANTNLDAEQIGFSDKFIYEEIAKPMDQRQISIKQMMRTEAQQAFKLWERSAMREDY